MIRRKMKPLGALFLGGRMVNHRNVLKLICNPLLRGIGLEIATRVSDSPDYIFEGYIIQKSYKGWSPNIFKSYKSSLFSCNPYDKVISNKEFYSKKVVEG